MLHRTTLRQTARAARPRTRSERHFSVSSHASLAGRRRWESWGAYSFLLSFFPPAFLCFVLLDPTSFHSLESPPLLPLFSASPRIPAALKRLSAYAPYFYFGNPCQLFFTRVLDDLYLWALQISGGVSYVAWALRS
jgi:hypothetical protein